MRLLLSNKELIPRLERSPMNFIGGSGKVFISSGVAIIFCNLAIWGFSIRSSIVKINLCPLQILSMFSTALMDLGSSLPVTNNMNDSSVILLKGTLGDNTIFMY